MAKKANPGKANLKFGKQPMSTTPNKEAKEQKFLTTSTSLGHVVTMMILSFCRRITNLNLIRKRIFIYFCIIFVGGLINDFAPFINHQVMFKVHKQNLLNQWFVKIGWFWTFLFTFFLIILTSKVLIPEDKSLPNSDKDLKKRLKRELRLLATRDLVRLLVNTGIWFVSTSLFLLVEDWTGTCSLSGETSKTQCLVDGHRWLSGFDISGHTFLLVFSNLIILEECAVMIGWEPLGHQLHAKQQQLQRQQLEHKQHQTFAQLSGFIRAIFILLTCLSLIWDFMLLQTSLFYHTMLQKLVAGLWATFCWFITYNIFFKSMKVEVRSPKFKNTNYRS